MSKIDEILFFQGSPQSSNMLADWQIKQAKAELLQLVLEVIGDDEPVDTEYFYYNQLHGHRNGLRAEQRKRAKELFGGRQ